MKTAHIPLRDATRPTALLWWDSRPDAEQHPDVELIDPGNWVTEPNGWTLRVEHTDYLLVATRRTQDEALEESYGLLATLGYEYGRVS